MTKTATVLLSLLFATTVAAQQKKKTSQEIPLQAENWEFKPGTVEFITHRSVPAMKLLPNMDSVILKNLDFKDGTIEYDMEPVNTGFSNIYFRRSSQKEKECFYLRTARSGKGDAVQYAPFIDGINLWDMLFHFQSTATIEKDKWNHVKLVISGKQMRAYVNNKAVLAVSRLEGNTLHGGLAFEGQAIISSLVVKPDQTEGLSPWEESDLTDHDPRYIRKWQISQPVITAERLEFSYGKYPAKETKWDTIRAERRGLINITRMFGGAPPPTRRLVWLKTNIHSDTAQIRKISLGLSDEVWIFINGKYLFAEQNLYGAPLRKEPNGRCAVENTSFDLPLMKGDNELMIAVANDFFGWGIIAQVDVCDNLVFEK